MDVQPKIAATAFLIADAARAAMLMTLADGRALPAGELAYAAGVTAQTASSHLAKLLDGGLITVEKEGRHRYYRLADTQVASLLENLAAIGATATARRKPRGRDARQLRFARCCYDHLAGQVGVAITQQLMQRDLLAPGEDKRLEVTQAGARWFGELGIDVAALRPGKHGIARQCLDWTERQHHLAGPLGVRFMSMLCENGWLRRASSSRAVQVTPLGRTALYEKLGVTVDDLGEDTDDQRK